MKMASLLRRVEVILTIRVMKILMLLFIVLVTTAQNRMTAETSANRGEELRFKLNYGWFTIGRAFMTTASFYPKRESQDCYQIDIVGKTAGLIGVFSKVNDKWGAIIRRDDFVPYYSYRNLKEGNYRKNEKVYFEYDLNRIRVEDYDVNGKKPRPTKYFNIKQGNVYDIIGGFMYIRNLDYRSFNKGDTLTMDAYYDQEFYDFEIVFQGVEMIRTKMGRINCYKLVPVMPDNKLFRGKNAVTFWISADVNRLPLKIEASMFFGTAYCELTSYKNVKSGIDFD